MLSAAQAGKAWKDMARSLPDQPEKNSRAGAAAYSALLAARPARPATGPARAWLLLRDRTRRRATT
ncbi:hypothetical protein LZP81_30670 [Streptomyces parvulus]|uniref:hypothetical protein n=1 Tax=Streptomyces parvulus TaxID=146923 RepID=UPI001E62EBC6|nr:hypothetical protein [Streptomyces parvulus]MCC9154931.1 hypothetical protein [Streptomyces parvulus]MCE7691224.1 hypothetical protein [Streptomyces parvulus]